MMSVILPAVWSGDDVGYLAGGLVFNPVVYRFARAFGALCVVELSEPRAVVAAHELDEFGQELLALRGPYRVRCPDGRDAVGDGVD